MTEVCDGKTWLKRQEFIHVCGDPSKFGYAALTPNNERLQLMALSFEANEKQLIDANRLSSVVCEVKNGKLAVETVVHRLGHDRVTGKVIVYTGDCKPAIQDLQKMKGTVSLFSEVKQLLRFAAAHDVQLLCMAV